MAKKDNPVEKIKEGVSVREIENFTKRHSFEILLALAVVVATISSLFDFFSGPGWSIALGGLGALISVVFTKQVSRYLGRFYEFVTKQEKSTQIIIGILRLVIALFLPFVIFAGIGLLAGVAFYDMNEQMRQKAQTEKKEQKKPPEENV